MAQLSCKYHSLLNLATPEPVCEAKAAAPFSGSQLSWSLVDRQLNLHLELNKWLLLSYDSCTMPPQCFYLCGSACLVCSYVYAVLRTSNFQVARLMAVVASFSVNEYINIERYQLHPTSATTQYTAKKKVPLRYSSRHYTTS
jgi:hypothetical protein